MATTERLKTRLTKAQVRPRIAALGRRIVEEDRDVLDLLEAYDRGEVTVPRLDVSADVPATPHTDR